MLFLINTGHNLEVESKNFLLEPNHYGRFFNRRCQKGLEFLALNLYRIAGERANASKRNTKGEQSRIIGT